EIAAVEATTPETWERIIRTNLTGPFLFCRASIPHLRAAGGGAIVNVSSVAGTGGAGFSVAYGASKAALVNFSQALAAELVADRIRVCAVSPGMIDTSMGRELLDTFHALFGIEAGPLGCHRRRVMKVTGAMFFGSGLIGFARKERFGNTVPTEMRERRANSNCSAVTCPGSKSLTTSSGAPQNFGPGSSGSGAIEQLSVWPFPARMW